jgi:hypothetical protein
MVDKIEIKDNFEIEIKGEKEGNKDIITDKPRECNFLITSDEYVHDYEWTDEMEERAKKLLAEDLGTIENPKTSMYLRLYFVRRNFGSSKQKLGKIL